MGISGLTSILERSSYSINVDLLAEAKRVRTQYQSKQADKQPLDQGKPDSQCVNNSHLVTIEQAVQRHAGKLILLVDGLGFFFELASIESIAGRWLPAYDLLHQRLVCLIESLRSQSIELIVYFDSPSTETTKQSTSVQRNINKLDNVRTIADKLSVNYLSISSLTPLITRPADSDSYSSQSYTRVKHQCLYTFESLNVSTILCEDEADAQLSHDARTYSQAVYGILSNDSDCAAMVGCRWIPVSSLVLEWGDATTARNLSSRECNLVSKPVFIDQLTESLYLHERSRVNFVSNVVSSHRPLFSQRYLIDCRCRVWTPGKVAQALGLSNPQQLVDLAILTGNDYTKDFVPRWKSIISPSKRYLDVADIARFLVQPNHRSKRLTDLSVFRGLLALPDINRAVSLSKKVYEGASLQSVNGKEVSLTAGVDRLNLSADDLSSLRRRLALDELPGETLSIISRDLINLSSYPEGSHSFTQQGSDEPRELWLPSTETSLRTVRASFAMFCGRRQLRLVNVNSGEQVVEEVDLVKLLPALARSLDTLAINQQLPLLLLPSLSLPDRVKMFVQSLSIVSDPLMEQVLNDESIPVWLRFPIVHFRFWVSTLTDRLNVRSAALKPWIEALQDMRLFLQAVHNQDCAGQSFHMILLHGGLSNPVLPLMTAVSLFSQYQSGWNRLRSLSRALDLPVQMIGREAPVHSMHGPLFLLFVHNNLIHHHSRTGMSIVDACSERLAFINQCVTEGKITVDGMDSKTLLCRIRSHFEHQVMFQSLIWC